MGIAEILALVAKMVPVASELVISLAKIKEQTETQHPEVWAKVRADFSAAESAWKKLQS